MRKFASWRVAPAVMAAQASDLKVPPQMGDF